MPQLADIKETARATWAKGDYDAMMRQEGLYDVGERLVDRLGVTSGEEVCDIACGTGNAAIPAAAAGARVTGLDLTPELLDVARQRAAQTGVHLEWTEGDAESLPFDDDRFDVVLSTFGCMFAPRHEVVADEIPRVLRPGGRMGLVTWTPDGTIGDFFGTVGAYLPPPPDFVDPPLRWGEEQHVVELFEGTGITCEFERDVARIGHDSVDAAVACYTTLFGPVVEARELAEADGRWAALRQELTDLFERHNLADDGRVVFDASYLVVRGHAAG